MSLVFWCHSLGVVNPGVGGRGSLGLISGLRAGRPSVSVGLFGAAVGLFGGGLLRILTVQMARVFCTVSRLDCGCHGGFKLGLLKHVPHASLFGFKVAQAEGVDWSV